MMKSCSDRIALTYLTLTFLGSFVLSASAATVTNGSFEETVFSWTATDHPSPFDRAAVRLNGDPTEFARIFVVTNVVLPSEGVAAFSHGFDGGAPGSISLFQDIGIARAGELLVFDFRVAWNMGFQGTLNRTFDVQIQPSGGGVTLETYTKFTMINGTNSGSGPNNDTGSMSGSVDLSPFAGDPLRVNFFWTIPETSTGGANFQLDNIRVIPEPSSMILVASGIAGCLLRRKRH